MNNLVIRKATPDDAEKMLEYLNQVGGESDNLLFGLNEMQISIEQEKSFIETVNNSSKDIMLLGLVDNEIASIASFQGFGRKRIAHRGEVAISVKKEYWHRGIGTKMMESLIDFAKSAQFSIVELKVKSDNVNAIALYEKLGFERIGTHKKFFKINDRFYDAELMSLFL